MALNSMIYGTDFIATHSFEEDTKTKHVERVAPGAGVLGDLSDTAVVTAVGQVSGLLASTKGLGRIVVECRCQGTGTGVPSGSLKFRLLFYNASNIIVGTSAEVSSDVTGILDMITNDSNIYYCTLTVFSNDAGASSVGVYVTGLPSASLSTQISLAAL